MIPHHQAEVAPRVLLIEDDPSVCALLRDALEESGLRVLSSDHALAPVDVAQLHPDLVLLDLMLAREDRGWRLLHDLRATPGASAIPVLVCTADHALVRRESDQLRALASGVVLKPFDLGDLLGRVDACRRRVGFAGSDVADA